MHRHGVRSLGIPFVLILQHPLVESRSRIVAPIMPAVGPPTLLAPAIIIGGEPYRAMMLDMTNVADPLIGPEVAAVVEEDAVTAALDAIFRGYPVGLPLR